MLAVAAAVLDPRASLVAQGTGRTQVRCDGQLITEVVIRSQAPGFGGIFARSPLLGRMVTSLHVTTAPAVIRNFVLLHKGERCSPLLRSESERILRAMPFIADASVTAYQDGMDGVRLEVATVDEPSLIGSVGVEKDAPFLTGLTVGNQNLLGNAVYASASWRDGFYYRDRFAGRYTNYQLWGRPYQLQLAAARRELGGDWEAEVSYPFLTDVQQSAWRVSGGEIDEYARFLRPGGIPSSLQLKRRFADAGAMWRVGRAGLLGLVGAQLSYAADSPAPAPVLVTDSGLAPDTTSALYGRFRTTRSARFNTLLGLRSVRFVQVDGFDALSGPQDLRVGTQLGLTVGHSLPASRGVARSEKYIGGHLFFAVGGRRSYAAIQGDVEGRRSRETKGWDDVLTNGRVAWYLKPHPRHLLSADVSWGGGWSARIPYQLDLGARRGGLRGYDDVELGGARRVIGRLEERWRVGSFRGSADAGVGIFTDVGQVWAGDVPLGLDSGLRQSVGVSLMAAVPPKSQRMWRLDLAFPLDRRDGSRWGLRLTNEDRTRTFHNIPGDVRRVRERIVPQSTFSWP
ncbi:MAG: hypothetical protein AMXMBFR55_22310 [Gemmatimonadota bacterium]